MSPDLVVAVVVTAVVAGTVAYVVGQRRLRRSVVQEARVPHRARQLIGALQSGAMIVSVDRRNAYSNGIAVSLGLARPDGHLHEGVADLAEKAWLEGEPVEDEIPVRRGVLGSVSTVHVRVVPLDDELCLAMANDRTEQRAAELSRREFAVNVSHELKTPVGALALLAETLEGSADDPELVRSFAAKIGKESRRLSKLIKEIIEISRLQGGDSVVSHTEVSIADVVAEAGDGAALGAQTRGIEFRVAPVGDLTVIGDADLLEMAVRNLMDNAVSYSNAGDRVSVAVTADDEVVSIAVIDQGIGIVESEQERIFERFYRTDPARSRETGGTGLGLSIVKHIAMQHGGDIGLWSRPGVGSTFTLRLPRYREAEDA